MEFIEERLLFNTKENFRQYMINEGLLKLIANVDKNYERIAFVCIGTDRSTGDCYGPLVGYNLSKSTIFDFDVYGTIHSPVHAQNLEETINKIDREKTLIVAIDSSLGDPKHIGYILMGYGGIKPGAGVGKNLPPVGDIYITGIVNISGYMPAVLLQNTRLSIVYNMAEITTFAIKYILYKKFLKKAKVV